MPNPPEKVKSSELKAAAVASDLRRGMFTRKASIFLIEEKVVNPKPNPEIYSKEGTRAERI